MYTVYFGKSESGGLEKIPAWKEGSWINISHANQDDLNFLAEEFDLDKDLLNDVLDPNEVPRVERELTGTYLFTRTPVLGEKENTTMPLLVVYTEKSLITISMHAHNIFDRLFDGRRRISTLQRTQLFFNIFYEINLSYEKALNLISRDVRKFTVSLGSISNEQIVQFVNYERYLNDFLNALTATNQSLERILTGRYFKLHEEDKEIMEDLSLSEEQLINHARSELKAIVNIRSAYSTILTNNLNRVIKLLTTVTILLTVPTMFAGIFGMNIAFPFDAQSPYVFWAVIAGSASFALALYMFIQRR